MRPAIGYVLPQTIDYVRTDADGTVTNGTMTGMSCDFSLGHGDKIEFKYIPFLTEYTVTEDEDSSAGYEVTAVNSRGTIQSDEVKVSFNNHRGGGVPTGADTPLNGNLKWLFVFLLPALATVWYVFKKKKYVE